jgi:hypothetical protein
MKRIGQDKLLDKDYVANIIYDFVVGDKYNQSDIQLFLKIIKAGNRDDYKTLSIIFKEYKSFFEDLYKQCAEEEYLCKVNYKFILRAHNTKNILPKNGHFCLDLILQFIDERFFTFFLDISL